MKNLFKSPHPHLYLIAEIEHDRFDAIDYLTAAVKGGVDMIQIREKRDLPKKDYQKFIDDLRARLCELGKDIPILVNDHIHIAKLADGVHLGQSDGTIKDARQRLGEQALIGLTVKTIQDIKNALSLPLNYLSIGGVFQTRSKHNPTPPLGIAGLKTLCEYAKNNSDIPLCAIAGLDENTLPLLAENGFFQDILQAVAVREVLYKQKSLAEVEIMARHLSSIIKGNKI